MTLAEVPLKLVDWKGFCATASADGPKLKPKMLKIAPCAIAALGRPGALLLAAFSTLVISGSVPAVTVALKLIDVRPATLAVTAAVPGLFPSVT